jgi:AcrR family transcriptional regulator
MTERSDTRPSLTSTLRDRRREQAVDAIAAIAHELFATQGFANTSVEEIATAAGCSPRTFYRYFGTKEEVMFYDLPSLLDSWTEILDELLNQGMSAWAAITESAVHLIASSPEENERIARDRMNLWIREPALGARYMQYIVAAEQALTERLIRAAEDDPEQRQLAPLRAAAAVGAYRVTLAQYHDGHLDGALADHARGALASMAHGLA